MENPKASMLLFKKAKITYEEVQKLSDQLAAALSSESVKKGDRVALIMSNCPQAIIGRWCIWKAGAVVVHMNPMYTDAELTHALKDCGAEVAIILVPFYDQIRKIKLHTCL